MYHQHLTQSVFYVSLSRIINDILTLDQQWLPNQSGFPPMSWAWYRLWPSPNYEWFPWSICNGCGMPAGNAYPSGHLVPSPILGLANSPIIETKLLELAMSLLDFSPRIPLGTFSISLCSVQMIPRTLFLFLNHWLNLDRSAVTKNIQRNLKYNFLWCKRRKIYNTCHFDHLGRTMVKWLIN